MSEVRAVRRALVSVSDKSGLVDLARALAGLGVSIVSSGSTASTIAAEGIPVTAVSDVTGFPEMLGGRVKTLHPKVHAGILADQRDPEHLRQIEEQGIEPFDLVVVNLYPFRETVASGAGFSDVIENIDIGGPTLVRAAAKNFESVAIVVDPSRYGAIVEEIGSQGGTTRETRLRLAAEAYAHTAAYDAAIASWFAAEGMEHEGMPSFVGIALEKTDDLRYGENPHQRAALYSEAAGPGVLGGAFVTQGKQMSFNNWLDVDAAYGTVSMLPSPACVIVKHNNPCGAAEGTSLADAYSKAFACDTVSAFGGIVAFNQTADAAAAEAMREVFTEVVVAPGYTDEARAAFATRENLRVVEAPLPTRAGLDIRILAGGALVQDRDTVPESRDGFEVVSTRRPTDEEWEDLLFAWTVAARVKSNAIVFAKGKATVGIGAGQMSRVDSSVLAVRKSGDRAKGAVMASDAFFPFPDAVQVAADAGIVAVIHPGGSIRDEEVLAEAEARGIAVVVTGHRHFRH
jgi:phosphoribosylaminoimidazolecarboxamide formyltransferase/IMP cyclohydrolase